MASPEYRAIALSDSARDLGDVDPNDDPDNELRYQFDRLNKNKLYKPHSVYRGRVNYRNNR
jgi:hypothetical protein